MTHLLIMTLFFPSPFQAIASEKGEMPFLPHFTRIGLDEGLSHATVFVIFQDTRGYLWFGTGNGLNRFDGMRFKVYHSDPNDPKALSSDNIGSIVEDDNGILWVGTWGGGLNRLDPMIDEARAFRMVEGQEDSLSNDYIHSIHRDGDLLWIGTREGLNRFDTKTEKFKRYLATGNQPGSLPHNRVSSVRWDGQSGMWLGTDEGLAHFDPSTSAIKRVKPSGSLDLGHARIIDMILDSQGRLWVVTARRLILWNPKDLTYREIYPGSLAESSDYATRVYEDRKGRIWWGSIYNGLWMYEDGKTTSFRHNPNDTLSINNDHVRALFEDRSGNLWAATQSAGLNRLNLNPPNFAHYFYVAGQGFPNSAIHQIIEEKEDVLWLASSRMGMTRWDRKNNDYQSYLHDPTNPKSLSDNGVNCITFDRNGVLWAGTFGGLNRMEPNGGFTHFTPELDNPNSLVHDDIFSLLADRDNILWIGSKDGLSRYDGKHFRNDVQTQQPGSIGRGQVECIFQDSTGTVWLGLNDGGLNRHLPETDQFKVYLPDSRNPTSISDDKVLCITEAENGLWIGTFGRGLNFMDPTTGNFKHYLQEDGLPNNVITGILPDGKGSLWISTFKGLSHMIIQEEKFINYDFLDGLQSNQFSKNSALRLDSGEMLFGGVKGVNAFFPERINKDSYLPNVVITGLKIRGKPIPRQLVDGSMEILKPDENFMEFEFAALDYTRPQKNRYQYQLQGVDPDWVDSKRPFVFYTGLASGDYTFKIKGTNHDGIWSPNETSVKIIIKTPFYKTGWAYSIYGLIVILCLTAFFVFQKRQERIRSEFQLLTESQKMAVEANRAKSAFLAHMSHELRTPLNVIIGYAEMLEEDMADEMQNSNIDANQPISDLRKIRSAAQYQVTLINNLLELTKIESGGVELFIESFSLNALVNRVVENMDNQVSKNGNTLEMDLPDGKAPMSADFTKVSGILFNLIGNAAKYTEQGKIVVRVTQTTDSIDSQTIISIEDNGCGMSQEQQSQIFNKFAMAGTQAEGSGLGLFLTKHFVECMGGVIEIKSELGKGSLVKVTLPTSAPTSTEKEAKS